MDHAANIYFTVLYMFKQRFVFDQTPAEIYNALKYMNHQQAYQLFY